MSGREPVAVAIRYGIWLETAARQWWAFWTRPRNSMAGLITTEDVVTPTGRQPNLVSRAQGLEASASTGSDERARGIGKAGRFRPVVNFHSSGSGDALLLLNGWTASGLLWPDRWLRDLEARFRVIRIDNRGSGWSRSAPTPYDIGDLADDAAAVLRGLGVESATVLGLSMGGAIAQELALRYPRLVSALVLVGTRPLPA